jgi:hypothetical protein
MPSDRVAAYEQNKKLFKEDLVTECKALLISHWVNSDELQDNAERFGHAYINTYKQYLSTTDDTENSLMDAGYHLVFAITALLRWRSYTTFEDVLEFAEFMISEQVSNLAVWCT